MKHDRRPIPFVLALAIGGLVCTSCATTIHEVDSLDTALMAEHEGMFVARILTKETRLDESGEVRDEPETEYGLRFGSSKSVMPNPFSSESTQGATYISVDASTGPHLVVRRLPAGDWYFKELTIGTNLTMPLAIKFHVEPGAITYVGDIEVTLIKEKQLLFGWQVSKARFQLGASRDAAESGLKDRFGTPLPQIASGQLAMEDVSMF